MWIQQLDSWVGLVNLAIKHKHENRSGADLWRLTRIRLPLIKDVPTPYSQSHTHTHTHNYHSFAENQSKPLPNQGQF